MPFPKSLNRKTLGLPIEEPGRYVDEKKVWGKDHYDPTNPLYRYDYWGEPKNSEKSKQERMTEDHNQSIVGKGTVWYDMSYEEAIEQRMQREAEVKAKPKEQVEDNNEEEEEEEEEEDDDDGMDFDYSILDVPSASLTSKPVVNGTESLRMSDEGMFEN